jgi:hypothetical protein
MTKFIKVLSCFLFEYLERAKYAKSFKRASEDRGLWILAEEGMDDYLKQLEEAERNHPLLLHPPSPGI